MALSNLKRIHLHACQMRFFAQLCRSWQHFDWFRASRGPAAIAEPVVRVICRGNCSS